MSVEEYMDRGQGGGAVKSVKKPDLHRCTRFPSQFSKVLKIDFANVTPIHLTQEFTYIKLNS